MGTNKTRVLFLDEASGGPFGINAVVEFDIYQEAFDYMIAVVKTYAVNSAIVGRIFSYDNNSYVYYRGGGAFVLEEIVFPQNP